MSLVKIEVIERTIARITLNRPEAANAMSIQLLNELSEALDEVAKTFDIRVVLLTGAGEKAFCAGADLRERKGMSEREVSQTVTLIGSVVRKVELLPQPVIAVLNGVAFGGGLELALACDIRIAGNHMAVGLTETSLGIIPGAGGTQRLPRLIGIGKAKSLIYSARRLQAEEAVRYGILEALYSSEHLQEEAVKYAKQIARNAPLALRQAKVAINQGVEADIQTALQIESLAYATLIPTEDRLEGLQAFQEKRTPHYKGE